MDTKKQLRLYKEESLPTSPIADSIYAIKSPTATSVVLYVIDSNGVAFPLRDLTSGGSGSGITTLVSGDNSITITGTSTSKDIQIAQPLLDLINSAIQSGANISEFINDIGYLTTETDPIFQASEASLFISGDKANLDNQSGVNTGDETTSTIQSKRPIKTIEGESIEGIGNVLLNNKADLVGGIHLQSQSRPSNVIYNSTNGVLSFTWADGSTQNIDLPVENLFENASYNSSTQILTLTTTTGGVIDIDLSSLVDLPEIVLSLNSNPSVLPTTGQKVYFRIDNGSYWINNSGTWSNEYKGFTQAEKTKLSGIEDGAQVNVNPDWNAVGGSSQILNKPTNLSQFTNDVNFVKLVDSNELYDYKTVTYNKTTNLPTFTSLITNNVEGIVLVITGATSRSFVDTNIYTRTNRLGIVTSSTNTLAQVRQSSLYINGNTGYEAIYKFGFSENATDTAIRAFIGLSSTTGLFSNVEPNTLLNVIGFCRLSTSNNLHLIYNDNSGIATTVDLGSNFPANTIDTDVYLAKINTVAGSNSIDIQLLRVNTNHLYTTTLTTNIPALSQGLNFGMYIVDTAGANTATGIDFMGMTIKN